LATSGDLPVAVDSPSIEDEADDRDPRKDAMKTASFETTYQEERIVERTVFSPARAGGGLVVLLLDPGDRTGQANSPRDPGPITPGRR
jgi:hypothetical protein